jgi:SAM-dependent methyltransferase
MSYEYWDKVYSTKDNKFADYDGWLNKYQPIWKIAENIIDLGCGCGVNSIFLNEHSINAFICDFSEVALSLVKSAIPSAQTMCFDMSEGLPFEDGFSDLVIADLSLHYFSKAKTLSILSDIHRVLSSSGHLLCRVNSVKDFEKNESYQDNREIEHHFYDSRKGTKRFFDRIDIDWFFSNWEIKHTAEIVTDKYKYPKYAWEICVGKRGTEDA